MKKTNLKRLLIIAAAVVLCAGIAVLAVTAAASDPTVVYNGITNEIEFYRAFPFPGNQDPDLFTNLKNMMPGDSVTQRINVGVKNVGRSAFVDLFLRAENPNEDYVKLIETYGHWVDFTVKNGDQVITDDLANGVYLGLFWEDETAPLDVTLTIDIEAGNELQDLVAMIDWVFTVNVYESPVFPPVIPDWPVVPEYPEIPDSPEDPEADDDLPWLTSEHINYIIGYEDGLVHPEHTITRAEVVTIFYRLLTEEARNQIWSSKGTYPDVDEESWYYIAICTLTNGGLIEGYPDGTFKPDNPITRAELATIISRFDQKYGTLEITEGFEDAEGHWAESYIEFAATRKYVVGYPDGTFKPDKPITRAETVTMVNRCLKRCVDEHGLVEGYLTWPDNEPDAWYYYEIIEAANYHSYVRSDRDTQYRTHKTEDWIELHPLIDWRRHEQEWLRELIRKNR